MGGVCPSVTRVARRGGPTQGARRAAGTGAAAAVVIEVGQRKGRWCSARRERATQEGALFTKCFGGRPRRCTSRRCGVGGRASHHGGFTKGFSGIPRRVPPVAESKGFIEGGAAAAAAPTEGQRAAPAPRLLKVRQAHAAAAALAAARPVARAARGPRGRRLVRAARPLRPDAVPARPRGPPGGARGAPRRLGQPLAVVRLFERRLAAVRAVLRFSKVYQF